MSTPDNVVQWVGTQEENLQGLTEEARTRASKPGRSKAVIADAVRHKAITPSR